MGSINNEIELNPILEAITIKKVDASISETNSEKLAEEKIAKFEKQETTEETKPENETPNLDDIKDFEEELEKDDFDTLYEWKQNIESKLNNTIAEITGAVNSVVSEANNLKNEVITETNKVINQATVYDNSQISAAFGNIVSKDFLAEKLDFLESAQEQLQGLIPGGFNLQNGDSINSLKKMIDEYVPPKTTDEYGQPIIPVQRHDNWLGNEALVSKFNQLYSQYDNLTNPLKNTELAARNVIDNNLNQLKDVFALEEVPSIDSIQNMLKLPQDFDMNKLSDFLKTNTEAIPDFDKFKELIKVPEIDKITDISELKDKATGVIANLEGFKKPAVSKSSTGLNFDRMSNTIQNAISQDFTEDTDWDQVMKFQAHIITQAVFNELANMTFYIEPGEIKVLTNGSSSTQKGKNTNRIKIKLK